MSDSLHARLPCPLLSPRVCSNACPLSQWWYLTMSSSAAWDSPFVVYDSWQETPFNWNLVPSPCNVFFCKEAEKHTKFLKHKAYVCMPSHVQLFAAPWTVRLFCLWDFPAKNAGEGCHFLFQGIFSTLEWTHISCVFFTDKWILYDWATWEAPKHKVFLVDSHFYCKLGFSVKIKNLKI